MSCGKSIQIEKCQQTILYSRGAVYASCPAALPSLLKICHNWFKSLYLPTQNLILVIVILGVINRSIQVTINKDKVYFRVTWSGFSYSYQPIRLMIMEMMATTIVTKIYFKDHIYLRFRYDGRMLCDQESVIFLKSTAEHSIDVTILCKYSFMVGNDVLVDYLPDEMPISDVMNRLQNQLHCQILLSKLRDGRQTDSSRAL
jgi:hypothetical protein